MPMVGDLLGTALTVQIKIGLLSKRRHDEAKSSERAQFSKQTHELDSPDCLLLYQAGFSLFRSFIDTVGYVKLNNLCCNSVFIIYRNRE